MTIAEMDQSRLWILAAPLDYRLLQRSMSATVEETMEVVAATKTDPGIADNVLRTSAESLHARTMEFQKRWQTLIDILEKTGVPDLLLGDILHDARGFIGSGRELLVMLGNSTTAYANDLRDAGAILDQIEPQLADLQRVQAAPDPEFDDARLAEGMAQMERGEGEDSGEILQRLLQTGKL